MGILKNIADAHNICILLVHHLRKAPEPGDPFARILGTQGINGASDTEEYIGAAPTRSCRPPNGSFGRIPQAGRAPRVNLPGG